MPLSRHRLVTALLCLAASLAPAQLRRVHLPGAGPGMVSLPYMSSDAQGNQWMVFGPGSVQMQGNSPVFSQAGVLLVNNMQPVATSNTGRIDDKTGELILENMTAGSINVTRRLKFKPESSAVRFVDVFDNPTAVVQTVTLRWTTNLNFGVQSASLISDPKRKATNLAWVAQTNSGQGAFDWVAGPGAKVAPTLNWQQGMSYVQSILTTSIPAGGKIAVVHVDGAADSTASATKWVTELNVRSLLADLPPDIRRAIVNVPGRSVGLATDLDLLRGDLLDVVQLRGGDRIVGSIAATSFTVHGIFGPTAIPADHVLGILAAGASPLWALTDGQVLTGTADGAALQFQTAGGGAMSIAWAQIERVGFRRRGGESADSADGVPPLPAPAVALLGGDRLKLTPLTGTIDLLTRYGPLHVPVDAIGSIVFTDPEAPVDVVTLTDGSRFTALTPARTIAGEAPLLGEAGKTISIDVNRIAVLQLHDAPDNTGQTDAPSLATTTGNAFTGVLQHAVMVQTPAGPISLDAGVISSIGLDGDGADHVMKITTADGTVVTGRPVDDVWTLHTATGLDVAIPVGEIRSYANGGAAVSDMSRSGLDPWISQLNADDWKQRDAAEHELVKLGPAVAPALRQARDKQTPEAQQRIDSILKQLEAVDRAAAGR